VSPCSRPANSYRKKSSANAEPNAVAQLIRQQDNCTKLGTELGVYVESPSKPNKSLIP
jgi:hypothetical protein